MPIDSMGLPMDTPQPQTQTYTVSSAVSRSSSDIRSTRAPQRLGALIAVCTLALAVLGVAVFVLAGILVGSFEQIETAEMHQKSAQVFRALDTDLRQLHVSNRDYAEFDDSVAFLETHNPAFISANFTREPLAGMHVDLVWIVDSHGNEVYSCYFDRNRNEVLSPAPRKYIQPLLRFASGRSRLASLSPAELIVSTPEIPLAVAAREIKRTDGSAPTGATLVFARFIAEAEVQRVRDTSQLPLTIDYLRSSGRHLTELPQAVRSWVASHQSTERTFVHVLSRTSISVYTLIRDLDGVPVAVLATTSGRDTFALGFRTTVYLLGGILALAVASGALVVWFVLRLRRSFAARVAVEERYRIIGEQLEEAVILVDASTQEIIEANQPVLAALGCTQAGLANHSVSDVFPEIAPEALEELARTNGRAIIESRGRRKGGNWSDAEVAIMAANIDGRLVLALVGHDVSHRKEAARRERDNRKKLLRVAQQDALTALPNRAFLNTRLPQVLRRLSGSGRLLALIYLDIDHFKHINDSRGHSGGDQLLQIVARRLHATLAAQDVVVRMGGDEFVIVATMMPDAQSIEQLATRLQVTVAAPIMLGNEQITVTISLGIAVSPDDGVDAETLLKRADIALYYAKNAGRNCHRFFSAEMDKHTSEQAALEQPLHQAVASQQIFMNYQPIVELATGRIMSLEALMRWRHPEQGLISPAQFIPVAERTGLIVELGEHALRQVLQQLRTWLDADVPVVPIAVNVSLLQLERTDFASLVERLALEAGVEMKWLRFEITESAVMRETERLIKTLATLRQRGSQILIDDFGTGYSSLSCLNQLPVDTLKIDRAFVRDLGDSPAGVPIINAIIDMARKLKLATIAEGVETAEQAALLLELGCSYGQGYLYSKPVNALACRALLQELRREAPLTQTVLIRALSLTKSA